MALLKYGEWFHLPFACWGGLLSVCGSLRPGTPGFIGTPPPFGTLYSGFLDRTAAHKGLVRKNSVTMYIVRRT